MRLLEAFGAALVVLLFYFAWRGCRWMEAVTDLLTGLVQEHDRREP